ncbi:hypothetical protein ACIHFB_17790 [Streptomyces sp. NPDC051963]|uniref:hypothetical protein n=1 Tax=Streptomyces sp. NPDC051963 TaxID=3365678 RepID=UPI0037D81ED0
MCHDSLDEDGQALLLDSELGALLDAIAARDTHVVAVLDCCHSGGATRDGDTAVPGATARGVEWRPWWRTDGGGSGPERSHVLLAACRPRERAHESNLDGRVRGWFSNALLHTLDRLGPSATYGQVHALTEERVRAMSPVQHPELAPGVRHRPTPTPGRRPPRPATAARPRRPLVEGRRVGQPGQVLDGRVEVVLSADELSQDDAKAGVVRVDRVPLGAAGRHHGPRLVHPGDGRFQLGGVVVVQHRGHRAGGHDAGLPPLFLWPVLPCFTPEFLFPPGVADRLVERQMREQGEDVPRTQSGHQRAAGQDPPVPVQHVVRLAPGRAAQPVQDQSGDPGHVPGVVRALTHAHRQFVDQGLHVVRLPRHVTRPVPAGTRRPPTHRSGVRHTGSRYRPRAGRSATPPLSPARPTAANPAPRIPRTPPARTRAARRPASPAP